MVLYKIMLTLAEIVLRWLVVLLLEEIHPVLSTLVIQPLETVSKTILANVYKIVIAMTSLDVRTTNVSATSLVKQQILTATPFSQTDCVQQIPITPQVMQQDMQFTQTTPTPTSLKSIQMEIQ
jgi:hypothetical protein